MAQVIHHQTTREVVQTSQGEVTVNLNVNLTILMENGALRIESAVKEDKVSYIIPDLEPVLEHEMIDFGKE